MLISRLPFLTPTVSHPARKFRAWFFGRMMCVLLESMARSAFSFFLETLCRLFYCGDPSHPYILISIGLSLFILSTLSQLSKFFLPSFFKSFLKPRCLLPAMTRGAATPRWAMPFVRECRALPFMVLFRLIQDDLARLDAEKEGSTHSILSNSPPPTGALTSAAELWYHSITVRSDFYSLK